MMGQNASIGSAKLSIVSVLYNTQLLRIYLHSTSCSTKKIEEEEERKCSVDNSAFPSSHSASVADLETPPVSGSLI